MGPTCFFACFQQILDRFRIGTALLVVVRQHLIERIQPLSPRRFDRPRHLLMHGRPLPPQQALVDRLLGEDVFEGVDDLRHGPILVDQLPLFQFPEDRVQVDLCRRDALQEEVREETPDDGRDLQNLLEVRFQAVGAVKDDAPDTVRDGDPRSLRGAPGRAKWVAVASGPSRRLRVAVVEGGPLGPVTPPYFPIDE